MLEELGGWTMLPDISLSSIAYRLGTIEDIFDLEELKPYARELDKFRDRGLAKVSVAPNDILQEIVECVHETLRGRGTPMDELDLVIYCGSPLAADQPMRVALQGLLKRTGLGAKGRLSLSGNGSGDVFSALEIAASYIASGASKMCLVISSYKMPTSESRLSRDRNTIKGDGVVTFLAHGGEGQLKLRGFTRIDHSEMGRSDSDDNAAASSVRATKTLMNEVSKLINADDVVALSTLHRTMSVPVSPALTFTGYAGKLRELNLVMAGQPLIEVSELYNAGTLQAGKSVIIHAATPHSSYAALITRTH